MTPTRRLTLLPALLLALCVGLVVPSLVGSTGAGASSTSTTTVDAARAVNGKRVVVISLDGLNPRAIRRLGSEGLPHLHRMLRNGAGTLNARSQVEQTVTLPNHTSMITGRRITAARGGHGVTWNDHLPGTTVQGAAGEDVASVFTQVHAAGGTTAIFSTKEKFSIFDRSWPAAVGRSVIRVEDDAAATRAMRADLTTHRRSFVFLHLGLADQVGHARGWMSGRYLRAVERLDALVGSVMRTVRGRDDLRRSTVVVLTADHGGVPGTRSHGDRTRYDNYRVPFVVWGAGVRAAGLYGLNPTALRPGRTQPGFRGAQPIRNGDVANLALDILGLGPVPGSLWNHDQDLRWR